MKKIILTSLLIATSIFLFTSCGGGSKSPKGIATELSELVKSGDYDTHFKKYFEYLDEAEKEDMPEEKQKEFVTFMVPIIKDYTEKQGGFKSFEISEEKIDGDQASVGVIYTYNSGETTKGSYEFAKKDGVWKITARENI